MKLVCSISPATMRMCLLTPLSRFIWRQRSCHCQHRWQSRKLDCFAHYYNFFGSSGSVGSMDVVHIKWANCPAGDHYRVKGKEGYPTLGFQCITDCNRLILGIFGPMFRAQNDKETVKLDHHVNSFTSTRIRDWARQIMSSINRTPPTNIITMVCRLPPIWR